MLRCPMCASTIDGVLNPSGRTVPQDWLPTVCLGCGCVVVFDHAEPGGLRKPVHADWLVWSRDPALSRDLMLTLAAVNTAIAAREEEDDHV